MTPALDAGCIQSTKNLIRTSLQRDARSVSVGYVGFPLPLPNLNDVMELANVCESPRYALERELVCL